MSACSFDRCGAPASYIGEFPLVPGRTASPYSRHHTNVLRDVHGEGFVIVLALREGIVRPPSPEVAALLDPSYTMGDFLTALDRCTIPVPPAVQEPLQ